MSKYIKDMESYLLADLDAGQDTVTDFDFLHMFAQDTHNDKLEDELNNIQNYTGNDLHKYVINQFHITGNELEKLP